jgi:hypothetical protein
MSNGVTAEQSKAISKKYSLTFSDETFSIKPPKLDGFMQRRAKDKDRLKAVNAAEDSLVSTQLKIMDIAPPLIDLYTRVSELEDGKKKSTTNECLQAVLQQWARAYFHITRQRRRTAVSLVEPDFDFLCAEPDSFAPGKEARELLFTAKFLESMLREASQDATLASTSRSKAVKRKASEAPQHTRVLRPRRLPEPLYQESRGASSGRRGRPSADNSWMRGGNRYGPFSCNLEHVGARLLYFYEQWRFITDDAWVLESVSQGVKFDFLEEPVQLTRPSKVAMSGEMIAVADKEVSELLIKKEVVEIKDKSEVFVCSLFVIPKKSGGFRPIVNLKSLNRFIRYEHFKMENLDSARFLLRKGD